MGRHRIRCLRIIVETAGIASEGCTGKETDGGAEVQEMWPWVGIGIDAGESVAETAGIVLEGCTGKGRRVSLVRIEESVGEPSSEWRRSR